MPLMVERVEIRCVCVDLKMKLNVEMSCLEVSFNSIDRYNWCCYFRESGKRNYWRVTADDCHLLLFWGILSFERVPQGQHSVVG